MSVSLERIYYNAMRKYSMKIIAGTAGIWNNVSWIHIVEDVQVADFLNGQELVVITGINRPDKAKLLEYIQKICEKEASGVIFNIGPFITEIPREIIEFCEEKGFPAFILPWEVHLVDFNKDFCRLIIYSEQDTQNLCSAYRNAIFNPEHTENYLPYLKSMFISPDEKYCLVKCMLSLDEDYEGIDITQTFYDIRLHFERVMNATQKKYVIFKYYNYITTVIPDTGMEEVSKIIKGYLSFNRWRSLKGKLSIAASRYDLLLSELPEAFDSLTFVCRLGKKVNIPVWYWEDLGVWNLILSIKNKSVLAAYKEANIGVLEKYDKDNGTDYCRILNLYFEYNGNLPEIAAECYIHRNTAAYHIKKIEEMLACDMHSTKDRVRLYLALCIKEITDL